LTFFDFNNKLILSKDRGRIVSPVMMREIRTCGSKHNVILVGTGNGQSRSLEVSHVRPVSIQSKWKFMEQ